MLPGALLADLPDYPMYCEMSAQLETHSMTYVCSMPVLATQLVYHSSPCSRDEGAYPLIMDKEVSQDALRVELGSDVEG